LRELGGEVYLIIACPTFVIGPDLPKQARERFREACNKCRIKTWSHRFFSWNGTKGLQAHSPLVRETGVGNISYIDTPKSLVKFA